MDVIESIEVRQVQEVAERTVRSRPETYGIVDFSAFRPT
jgi:hypothetical protein